MRLASHVHYSTTSEDRIETEQAMPRFHTLSGAAGYRVAAISPTP